MRWRRPDARSPKPDPSDENRSCRTHGPEVAIPTGTAARVPRLCPKLPGAIRPPSASPFPSIAHKQPLLRGSRKPANPEEAGLPQTSSDSASLPRSIPRTLGGGLTARNPLPSFFSPETLILVAPSINKLQELSIRDGINIDAKCGNLYAMRLELIVPAKMLRAFRAKSQCRFTGWDFDHPRHDRFRGCSRRRGLRYLSAYGQAVEHIGKRFGVHEPMFDRHVQELFQRRRQI